MGQGDDAAGDRSPAPARPAATLLVVRGGPLGLEVLMLRRAPASRFAPGYVVFPGGVVEQRDAQLADDWFEGAGESARACAVRELAEEAALAVTRLGIEEAADAREAIELVGANPPLGEQLTEIAHWVAPAFLARRFDARFFAAAAGVDVSPRPDGIEIDGAWWGRPADVLGEFELWTSLMWPTYRMLEALAECEDVAAAMRLRVVQEPPPAHLARLRSPEWGTDEVRL